MKAYIGNMPYAASGGLFIEGDLVIKPLEERDPENGFMVVDGPIDQALDFNRRRIRPGRNTAGKEPDRKPAQTRPMTNKTSKHKYDVSASAIPAKTRP